jgi:hypothetical protein
MPICLVIPKDLRVRESVGEEKLTEKRRRDILAIIRRRTFMRLFQYATFIKMALHFAGDECRLGRKNEKSRFASAMMVWIMPHCCITSHASRVACSGLSIFFLLIAVAVAAISGPKSVRLHARVVDEDGKPVAGLEVRIQSPDKSNQVVRTDIAGKFEYAGMVDGEYRLSLNKPGFFCVSNQTFSLKSGDNEIAVTINHETEIHEQVEVYSSSVNIDPLITTHSEALIAREIRDIPVSSTHDLRNNLRTLPEVVQDNSGQLHIAGGRTGETQYVLDGFDIGDPVTGELSVRVNVDSVRSVEVESGRFNVQYGNGGSGVLSMDTAVGDDRWRASATNFFPGISAEHGIRLTTWYPRFTLSGPLHKDRAWFSEALSVQHTLSFVRNLPREQNSVAQWNGNNMLRTQIKLTPQNILHGSFLYDQNRASNLGLGAASPISTTRGLRSYRSFFSLKEQVWSGRTFYELGIAGDFSHSENRPHGFELYRVTPNGSSGNYFESLWQKNRRWQAIASVSLPTRRLHGTHNFLFGLNGAEIGWDHSANRNPIEVVRVDNTLAQRTIFSGTSQFNLRDFQLGVYGHDVWRVSRPLVLQLGIRADWDRTLRRLTPSPRISVNFMPFISDATKLTVAWGLFLQPVTLSSLGPAHDQQRSDTFYSYEHPIPILGPEIGNFVLPSEHLRQPRFYTTSLGWEQRIAKHSQAEIHFTQRNGRLGLAYEKMVQDSAESLFLLQNNRRDYYRSLQISFRHSFSDKTAFSASYTRSSAKTNRIWDYSLATPVFAPQESGPLGWDTPNRFVSSGWAPAPIGNLFLSYFFEYRTGFPFSTVNEQQQVIGPANRMRLPDYAGLNIGIEKRLRLFTRTWSVRFTILNITNHNNPDGSINNINSPRFLQYFGGQGRALTARVRLVG